MSSEWRYDQSSGTFRPSSGNGNKNGNSWISWGLIVFLFVMGLWPLGLGLLIAKLADTPTRRPAQRSYGQSYGAANEARRAAAAETASQARRTGLASAARQTNGAATIKKAAKSVTQSPADTDKSAKVLQIVGAAVMAIFGLGLISEVGDLLSGWGSISSVLSVLAFVAGGALTFTYGRKMKKRRNRIERYKAVMGERDYISLVELMAVVNQKQKVAQSDLEYMTGKGLLGTGAFVDESRGILFRSADAYQRYLTERTKKENLTPKEATEGYAGALRAIREANDRIPDPVFSEKLDHMELVAGRIFREVEAHPEKQKQASTFLDYYLPTTLKLLATYTEFEEAGIEGENLRAAKARIESIMDTLLENFDRQLDELYRSEAMDVDSDIRVMENMLARDLGSVERDFGLGGTAAVRQPTDME